MTKSNHLKLVLLGTSLMFVFILVHLYQKKSMNAHFQHELMPSPNSSRSKSAELVFLKIPTIRIDLKMNVKDMDKAFFKFLSLRHFACENSVRFGNAADGGWDICLAEPFRPKQPCLVYSFGINNDFSFDDAIANNFGCDVRSFDPSMQLRDHQRSPRVWFYKIGIGGHNTINDKGWILKTLPDIVKSMNESDVIIDYLKMDVEGSEWPSLVQMMPEGTLSRVKQLGIEFHISRTDARNLFNMYQILSRLEDQGFRRWRYYNPNTNQLKLTGNVLRSCCYEMVYINTRFLTGLAQLTVV